MAAVMAAAAASPPPSPTNRGRGGLRLRQRRKKTAAHITWDEEAIAEHDKERGTRQKIDEPDTPFIRSPQSASDGESVLASSDDERRISFRESVEIPCLPGASMLRCERDKTSATDADVNPEAIADRLDAWVRSGSARRKDCGGTSSGTSNDGGADSACSSRSSSSAPARSSSKPHSRSFERRTSFPDDSQPQPASDSFKAKRAQHYNEMAAIKAFKQQHLAGETDSDSSTSDEEQHDGVIMTNTNTNINITTISKSEVCRQQKLAKGRSGKAVAVDMQPPTEGCEANNDRESSRESVGDKAVINVAAGQASSSSSGAGTAEKAVRGVALCVTGGDDNAVTSSSSAGYPAVASDVQSTSDQAAWKAKRQAHYNEMAAALRAAPPPSDDEDDDDEDEEEDTYSRQTSGGGSSDEKCHAVGLAAGGH